MTKWIDFAFPTSILARKYKCDEGCYVIVIHDTSVNKIENVSGGFKTIEEAIRVAHKEYSYPWSKMMENFHYDQLKEMGCL